MSDQQVQQSGNNTSAPVTPSIPPKRPRSRRSNVFSGFSTAVPVAVPSRPRSRRSNVFGRVFPTAVPDVSPSRPELLEPSHPRQESMFPVKEVSLKRAKWVADSLADRPASQQRSSGEKIVTDKEQLASNFTVTSISKNST
ncbi:unnamed protein product, partial [Strongylus vulgaris]